MVLAFTGSSSAHFDAAERAMDGSSLTSADGGGARGRSFPAAPADSLTTAQRVALAFVSHHAHASMHPRPTAWPRDAAAEAEGAKPPRRYIYPDAVAFAGVL